MALPTIKPESLTLYQNTYVNDNGFFICTDTTSIFAYDKENRVYTDKRIGTKVEVVIPQQKYERIVVQLPMGFDDLLVPNAKLRFEGFESRFYRDFQSGEYFLSAKASSVVIVK